MSKPVECWVIPYGDGDGVVGPFWTKEPAITERRRMLSRSSCVGEVVHLIDAARLAEVERERDEAREVARKALDLFTECYACGTRLLVSGFPHCIDTCDPSCCTDCEPESEWRCEVHNARATIEAWRTK